MGKCLQLSVHVPSCEWLNSTTHTSKSHTTFVCSSPVLKQMLIVSTLQSESQAASILYLTSASSLYSFHMQLQFPQNLITKLITLAALSVCCRCWCLCRNSSFVTYVGCCCLSGSSTRTHPQEAAPVICRGGSQTPGKLSISSRYLGVIFCLNEVHGCKGVNNLAMHKS